MYILAPMGENLSEGVSEDSDVDSDREEINGEDSDYGAVDRPSKHNINFEKFYNEFSNSINILNLNAASLLFGNNIRMCSTLMKLREDRFKIILDHEQVEKFMSNCVTKKSTLYIIKVQILKRILGHKSADSTRILQQALKQLKSNGNLKITNLYLTFARANNVFMELFLIGADTSKKPNHIYEALAPDYLTFVKNPTSLSYSGEGLDGMNIGTA